MNALEITDLTKRFKSFAIDKLNLTLPSGCIMGLIGENGAGKTTVIKLILDMIRKDSGSIKIFGRENTDNIGRLKENIGVVLDNVGIPNCLDVSQVGNIMKHTFSTWDEERYKELLGKLSLPAGTQFKNFSRGMKMKLGIAIALSHQSRLLLLDEATGGLDPVVRDEVLDILNEYTRDEGHSILISSHIVSDLEKLCDYVAFLHKGKLILCEDKDVLLSEYGIIGCTQRQLNELDSNAVLHKKQSGYGIQAIVKRRAIPREIPYSPVSIEELFVAVAKEEK